MSCTSMRRAPGRWNHNLHFHPLILEAIPDGARRALDVGCGVGTLTRDLAERVPEVVGIDRDPDSLATAREETPAGRVEYVLGDVLSHPFPPASFDVVASVATLHHMDAEAGIARMRELLRPGGLLAVVGLARSRLPRDLGWEVASDLADRWQRRRRIYWEHPSPTVWPPPVTYEDMRRLTARTLPGARFRRHALWRYSVLWRAAPVAAPGRGRRGGVMERTWTTTSHPSSDASSPSPCSSSWP